jgi:hypothetical protein
VPDFIPYGRQTITEADIEAVVQVLRSPFLTQGPAVPSFEQAVVQRHDVVSRQREHPAHPGARKARRQYVGPA